MPFQKLGLTAGLLRAVSAQGYTQPTPIQAQCIPVILEGRDVLAGGLGVAGETLAAVKALLLATEGSRVVNVASIAAKTGAPYISAYAASKHAVLGFTRSVAAEVATTGVTVNAVCPGYVDTPMTDRSVERIVEKTGADPEQVRDTMRRTSPQNRLMEPEEAYQAALRIGRAQ